MSEQTTANSVVAAFDSEMADRRPAINGLWIVSSVCAVLFIALAVAAHHAGNLPLDHRVDSALFRAQGTAGHRVATAATVFGSAPGVAGLGIVSAIWLAMRRRPVAAWMVLACPVIGAAAEILAKKAVDRYQEPSGIGDHFRNQHFPSGHVTGYTSLALAIVLTASLPLLGGVRARLVPLLMAAFAGATLVSVSRVVLGAHFFTDTVGGFLLGTGVTCAVACAVIALRPTERCRALQLRGRLSKDR